MGEGGPVPPTCEEFVADRLDPLLRYATALTCDAHLAKRGQQESGRPTSTVVALPRKPYSTEQLNGAAKTTVLGVPGYDWLGKS
jgi:hypothetical protein